MGAGCQGNQVPDQMVELSAWPSEAPTSREKRIGGSLSVTNSSWLSFIELDKAVVLVWLDWLLFCEYSFSVSALWCPLATPIVLLGFLLPWTWGISSWLLQQIAAAAPYLGWGVSPHCHPSWPSTWDSSSRPSCARRATVPYGKINFIKIHVRCSKIWLVL